MTRLSVACPALVTQEGNDRLWLSVENGNFFICVTERKEKGTMKQEEGQFVWMGLTTGPSLPV